MPPVARQAASPIRFFVLASADSKHDAGAVHALTHAPVAATAFTDETPLQQALGEVDSHQLPVVIVCAGVADAERVAQRLLRHNEALYLILLAAPGDQRTLTDRFRNVPVRAQRLELLPQADPALADRVVATADALRRRRLFKADIALADNMLLRFRPQPLDLTEGAIQRQLFDVLPVGVAIVTLDGYVADLNDAARRLLLAAGSRHGPMRLADLIPQWSAYPVDALPVEDVITMGHDRKPIHLRLTSSQLSDRHTTNAVLITVQDVTEQEQARQVLTATKDELEQRVLQERETVAETQRERDAIKQFIASLTHDLRSPVAAALLSCQLLQRRAKLDDKSGSLLQRVKRSLNRLERMIEDLLDLTRHDTGAGLPIEPEPMRLDNLLRETLDELTQVFNRPIVLQEPVPAVEGRWDIDGVRRIIENLGTNAIKYGDPAKPAEVSLTAGEQSATLRFCNFGPPIPLSVQSAIFEPFYRAQNADARAVPGWGVGLAFVRAMTESHGGSVSLSSSERGTVFSVRLPIVTTPD